MKFDWSYYKNMFMNAQNEICIFERMDMPEDKRIYRTAMETVVDHISLITVNKYLRILGTSDSTYESVFGFTKLFKEIYNEEKYIIAHDVFGGLFATERTIHYFAPDSLEWEDLEINYEEFIEWAVKGNINEFYQQFLWNGFDEMISKVSPDEGVFVYPFLWAKECDVNTAFKKIVPYRDILVTNYENMLVINDDGDKNGLGKH
ncbi:MAG: DUF2625 domain-containing protein [Clostridium sp.]|nr:DUF2625 domain-containing protein [Clostridium sp.]